MRTLTSLALSLLAGIMASGGGAGADSVPRGADAPIFRHRPRPPIARP